LPQLEFRSGTVVYRVHINAYWHRKVLYRVGRVRVVSIEEEVIVILLEQLISATLDIHSSIMGHSVSWFPINTITEPTWFCMHCSKYIYSQLNFLYICFKK